MPEYDYASAGGYFVTISTHKQANLFGRIIDQKVSLSAFGEIAKSCWQAIPTHFPQVIIDQFIVMPNHMHGILFIKPQHAAPLRQDGLQVTPGSLGAIVRSYKAAVTKQIRELQSAPALIVWQRNYYERVIRDEVELEQMRFYILHNALPH
ncbi:MAG: hypothetical protein KF821_03255 [Anaerolineales bacterium]|nr:hypothetical protein [Anaerolineales bacterium]